MPAGAEDASRTNDQGGRRGSLSVRFIAILAGASVLPVVAVGLLAAWFFSGVLIDSRETALRQFARHLGQETAHLITQGRADAQDAARLYWPEGGSPGVPDVQGLQRLLDGARNYDDLWIYDGRGGGVLHLRPSSRPSGPTAGAAPMVPPVDVTTPRLVMWGGAEASQPTLQLPAIDPQGQQRGVIVLGFARSALAGPLLAHATVVNGEAVLADDTGRVLARSAPEDISGTAGLVNILGPGWQDRLNGGKSVMDSGPLVAAWSAVRWSEAPGTVLHVVAFASRQEVLSPVRRLLGAMSGLAVIVLALSLLVGFQFTRRLVIQPFEDLRQAMRRFQAGDLSARADARDGELGELAYVFNEMASALATSRLDLEQLVDYRTRALEQEVAERQRAQAILAGALDAMQEGFTVFDAEDRLVAYNAQSRLMLGPNATSLQPGSTIQQLVHSLAHSGYISSAAGREDEWVAETLARHRQPRSWSEEHTVDGHWFEVREWRTPDGGSVAIRLDVTDRKRAERALRESERRFRELFNNLQDAAVVFDAHEGGGSFRIADLNLAAERMDRIRRGDAIGREVDEVFPAAIHINLPDTLRRVWRDMRPERLPPFNYDDPLVRGWREMVLFPLSAGEVAAVYRDVTAELEAKEALTRSEERNRILVQTMSEGLIVTDRDLRITYVNDRFAAMVARPHERLMGLHLDDAFHSCCRDELPARRDRTLRGESGPYEAALAGRDGRRLEVLVSPAPFYDAAGQLLGKLSVVTDITELKQAQIALRDSELRFRALFEDAPFGMVLVSGDGRLVAVNRAFHRILGTADGASGQPKLDPTLAAEVMTALVGDGSYWEGRITRPDGGDVWVRAHAATVADPLGGPPNVIATVEDISERKALEGRMAHSSKLMLLGELSAGLAHEITQPLNVIRLTSEAALARIDAETIELPETRVKLKVINEQADRLFDVIDYMQAFSRRESERREPFDLFASLRAAVDLVDESFRQRRIVIHTDIEDRPCVLLGHPRQLEQVLLNLLTNGRDAITDAHGNQGGGIFVTARREVASGQASIRVEDDGTGIPEGDLARIFEPFFSTKGPGKGTGLGLSISFGIINGMGGTMRAGNREDCPGACFDIALPLAVGADGVCTPLPPPKEEEVTLPPSDNGVAHIMVVEDEALAAQEIADHLMRCGFRVSSYSGGEAALAAFPDNPADLLVTDLNMPDGDGHGLIEALLADYPYLPVIVLTGRPITRGEDLEEAGAGADLVLRKPIRLRELVEHIRRLLV